MLTGRTAVITGGAQGIGLAIAHDRRHGARIVIGDLDEAKAKEAAASLKRRRDRGGLRCRSRCRRGDASRCRHRGVRISAGDGEQRRHHPGCHHAQNDREQFDDVITVHLRGCWNGTRRAAGIMRESGGRVDHRHVVDLGQGRLRRADQLFCGEGGHCRFIQGGGQRGCAPGCSVNVIQPGLIPLQ